MRGLMFSFLILCFCISCSEPAEKGLAEEVATSDTCDQFVQRFPSSFHQFDSLYGFKDGIGGGPLYDVYEEHISYFFNCEKTAVNKKLERVIAIAAEGEWDADAVGMFQDSTVNLIRRYPKETLIILEHYSDKQAGDLWHFLFDGPHPNDQANRRKMEALTEQFGKDHKQTKLLQAEFQNLLSDADHNEPGNFITSVRNGKYKLTVTTLYSDDTLDVLDHREDPYSSPIITDQKLNFYSNSDLLRTHSPPLGFIEAKTISKKGIRRIEMDIYRICIVGNGIDSFYLVEAAAHCNGTGCPEFIGIYSMEGKNIYESKSTEQRTSSLADIISRYNIGINKSGRCTQVKMFEYPKL